MDILERQLAKIQRGCAEIISVEELKKKLAKSLEQKIPLRIKAGFDPTAPDIHIGHTVILRTLRQFQDLGHTVLFLIGDFTARIGDPAGQNKTRPPMSDENIQRNAATYKAQVYKVLEPQKTEVVFNNDWFSKMSAHDISKLMHHGSVSQILAREDFKARIKQGRDVRLNEFIYPLLQAYDSVYLKADVEIGGTDQKFNFLLGRQLQADFGQEPQVIIMLPLLEGLDGINKMSKSLGNYIAINDAPDAMFGKVMSISDTLMYRYYELLTDEDMLSVKTLHPKEAKERLAMMLISQYHGHEQAAKAMQRFLAVFKNKEVPEDIPEFTVSAPKKILDVLTESMMVKSKNEARRLIQQGAVTFLGAKESIKRTENRQEVIAEGDFLDKKITDENFLISEAGVIKAGSRRFLKVIQAGLKT